MKFESFSSRLSIPAFIQMWAISGHFAHFAYCYVYHLFFAQGLDRRALGSLRTEEKFLIITILLRR